MVEAAPLAPHHPQDGRSVYQNRLPTSMAIQSFTGGLHMLGKWVAGGQERSPQTPVPVVQRQAWDYRTPPQNGVRVTWLGHSSVLLELGALHVLTDPVWSLQAGPFTGLPFGVRRFFPAPIALDALPPLDAVVISHDHYDHLDRETVTALAQTGVGFYVPLGVAQTLVDWGIPSTQVHELDWWQGLRLASGLTLTATPARHFSGRGVLDRDQTLWCSWVIASADTRVFFGGDGGLTPEFIDIGQRLGPFALTLIEVGAYNAMWADVHIGPEQAVRAHQALRGALLLPIHWGTFQLALHTWTEPAERVWRAAENAGVRLVIPKPGELVLTDTPAPVERWWPSLPYETAEEAPVVSSGCEDFKP